MQTYKYLKKCSNNLLFMQMRQKHQTFFWEFNKLFRICAFIEVFCFQFIRLWHVFTDTFIYPKLYEKTIKKSILRPNLNVPCLCNKRPRQIPHSCAKSEFQYVHRGHSTFPGGHDCIAAMLVGFCQTKNTGGWWPWHWYWFPLIWT